MLEENRSKQLLLFEDDKMLAKAIIQELGAANYQVFHYESFPEGGTGSIQAQLGGQPDIVITDVVMPGLNGYQVCEALKTDYLDADVPVIFMSSMMSENNIMHAYDVGGDDYLVKPVRIDELRVKLDKLIARRESHKQHQEMLSDVQKMAFDAMASCANLGEILRFHEQSYQVQSPGELASLLFNLIGNYRLSSSILFFGSPHEFFSDCGEQKPLEIKLLNELKNQPRVYHWNNRTIFNYQHFSLLVRNMPDDRNQYGSIKDELCILLNGLDARIESLMIERANQRKAITMKIVAHTIANMVMEIETSNVELSEKFEAIILTMEANISADIVQFNLLQNEEEALLNHVVKAAEESSRIFEGSLQKERQYKEIMTRLLKDLISNAQ